MADNVTLPATGTGTASVVQATDDVSGVHYPKVKLIDSTADSTTPVGVAGNGAATNALRVTVANDSTGIVSLTTSTASIGKLAANDGVDIGNVDVASVVPGTGATNLGKAEDAAHNTGDVGVMVLGVANTGHTAFAANGDYVPINVDTEGCVVVVGNIPHDTADADPPIKVGGKAIADLAGATMVAAADRANMTMGLDAVQIVRPYTTISNSLCESVSNTNGTATASTVFGATASTKNCITTIAVFNTSTTTSGNIIFTDGSGGTTIFALPLPAGGGAVCNFPVPLVQPTANTALYFDVSAAISTVYISLIGFKSKA